MSKKATRSSKPKPDPDAVQKPTTVAALKKVLYISEKLLELENERQQRLCLERFYHPGKGQPSLFVTHPNGQIMELLEFTEPRRSWLINNEVCSNGRLYMSMPLDVTLLAVHNLRKHCFERALSLDTIAAEEPSTSRLLNKFVTNAGLLCIADVKVSGDLSFYKFNTQRTLAWLTLKTRQVQTVLKQQRIPCGHGSAQSQNFVRSEKLAVENVTSDMDYLRMACDIVGRYLDADLHEQLVKHLHIPSEIQAAAQKRKSQQGKASNGNAEKKIKLNSEPDDAVAQLKKSALLDSSCCDDEAKSPAVPLKERTLTAKEKSLAKGAKGLVL